MSTNYPFSIDSFTTTFGELTDQAVVHALNHNKLGAAVTVLESKLGTGSGTPAPGTTLTATGTGTSTWVPTVYNVRAYGAKGDGVTDDYAAIQAAINATGHGADLFFPAGTYMTSGTLTFTGWVGGTIRGTGRYTCHIVKTTAGDLVRTNEFAYSRIIGINFSTTTSLGTGAAIFNLDWDGTSHGGIALQANTFQDCLFDAGGATVDYGVLIGITGYMGSENLFLNCHFGGFAQAAVYSANPNALQNTLVGGNIQACSKNGIWVHHGTISAYSVGFQNGTVGPVVAGNPTLTQTGYDVQIDNSANDGCIISGCRSESFRLLSDLNGQQITYDNNRGVSGPTATWTASTAYTQGTWVAPNGYAYVCTVAGTSGTVQPAFSGAATYTDGTVTWKFLDFTAIEMYCGTIQNCTIPWGSYQGGSWQPMLIVNTLFSREDWAQGGNYPFSGQGTSHLGNCVVLNVRVSHNGGFQSGTGFQPVAYSVQVNKSTAGTVLTAAGLNLGAFPLLFSTGSGNSGFGDVGIGPGDGTTSGDIHQRILALYGALGQVTPTASNTAGTDTYIFGGLSTGTGAPGKIHLGTASAGSTGATVNTASDVVTVDAGNKLGFYGHATVAQQLLATGASHTVDDVITALQALGLVRQT